MTRRRFSGILNVNKPAGLTSRQVVDRVVRLVRPAKAGHAGTLDPMASGVLVVCVGGATRLVPFVQQQEKEYRAQFLLGRRSNTDDVTGEVVETPARPVSREEIERLLPQFTGTIQQTPPQFSAVHVGGQRAYKLARQGRTVEIEPKTVEVHRIELTAFAWPELELDITCGSGTYIRSIGRDLGELLGCGAVMSDLVRTRIGPFRLDESVEPDRLDDESLVTHLQSATTAVAHLPRYECTPDELTAVRHGRPIRCREPLPETDGPIALITPDGELAALAEHCRREQMLAPKQVFPESG